MIRATILLAAGLAVAMTVTLVLTRAATSTTGETRIYKSGPELPPSRYHTAGWITPRIVAR